MLVGDQCIAKTYPTIQVNNPTAQTEHEASTTKLDEEKLFYLQSRGLSMEESINLLVTGFCDEVMKELPLEFMQEADKLLTLKLENSVG